MEDETQVKAEGDAHAKQISPMKKRYDEYRKGITNQQVRPRRHCSVRLLMMLPDPNSVRPSQNLRLVLGAL